MILWAATLCLCTVRKMVSFNIVYEFLDGLYTLKFGNQSLGNFGQLRASNGDLEISPLQDTPGLNKSMVTNYPTYSLYENSRNDRIAFRQSRANSDLRMNDSTNIVNNSRCGKPNGIIQHFRYGIHRQL